MGSGGAFSRCSYAYMFDLRLDISCQNGTESIHSQFQLLILRRSLFDAERFLVFRGSLVGGFNASEKI